MTTQLKIGLGTTEVNFTSLDAKVVHRFSNPFIVADTPRDPGALNESASICINIGFITESFEVTFTLTDGLGAMDYQTPTTNYEKLFHMAYRLNPKTLTINDKTLTGHIENLTLPWEAGKMNLSIGGSLSFRVSKNIEMEPSEPVTGVSCTFSSGSVWVSCSGASTFFHKDQQVYFTTDGAMPTGVTASTLYFVVSVNSSSLQISATKNGQPIAPSSSGTAPFWAWSA